MTEFSNMLNTPQLLEDAQAANVVWARVRGFPFWPVSLIDDASLGLGRAQVFWSVLSSAFTWDSGHYFARTVAPQLGPVSRAHVQSMPLSTVEI